MIKSVKTVLSTMLKGTKLTDENLLTVFCEVESIVSSRPLTSVYDDVNDLEVLIPSHLLLMRSTATLPPSILIECDSYVKGRWRHVQHLANEFWTRWVQEYLPTLQNRSKWLLKSRNQRVGDIVMIVKDNVPRSQWSIACIL